MTSNATNASCGYPRHSISVEECTLQDRTTVNDNSDTTGGTSMLTIRHQPAHRYPNHSYSLARPPMRSRSAGPEQPHPSVENTRPPKPVGAGNRDRFITKANYSAAQSGGLAEACGVKTNRVLEFGIAPPMKRKLAAAEIMGMYAQHQAPTKTSSGSLRKISNKPSKILDAPGILDDFYANIIDWSASFDYMAIGLGSTVYCWNPQTSDVSVIAELDPEGSTGTTVTSLKWSNEDTCLGIATSKGEVQIWDTEAGSLVRSMRGRNCGRVAALSWAEPILSSGGRDGSIWNHDVRIKQHKVAELRAHSGEVCGLQWRGDSRMLASGGNDNLVALWDARVTSVPKHQVTKHQAAVKALAWCPWQSNLLATGGGSADRQIHFWNAASGHCVNSIDAGSQVTSLHWNKHYKEIVGTMGYPYNSIGVWSYPTLLKQTEISAAHDSRILDSALSMDKQTLVTCAADENIKFWNLFELQSRSKKRCHPNDPGFSSSFSLDRI